MIGAGVPELGEDPSVNGGKKNKKLEEMNRTPHPMHYRAEHCGVGIPRPIGQGLKPTKGSPMFTSTTRRGSDAVAPRGVSGPLKSERLTGASFQAFHAAPHETSPSRMIAKPSDWKVIDGATAKANAAESRVNNGGEERRARVSQGGRPSPPFSYTSLPRSDERSCGSPPSTSPPRARAQTPPPAMMRRSSPPTKPFASTSSGELLSSSYASPPPDVELHSARRARERAERSPSLAERPSWYQSLRSGGRASPPPTKAATSPGERAENHAERWPYVNSPRSQRAQAAARATSAPPTRPSPWGPGEIARMVPEDVQLREELVRDAVLRKELSSLHKEEREVHWNPLKPPSDNLVELAGRLQEEGLGETPASAAAAQGSSYVMNLSSGEPVERSAAWAGMVTAEERKRACTATTAVAASREREAMYAEHAAAHVEQREHNERLAAAAAEEAAAERAAIATEEREAASAMKAEAAAASRQAVVDELEVKTRPFGHIHAASELQRHAVPPPPTYLTPTRSPSRSPEPRMRSSLRSQPTARCRRLDTTAKAYRHSNRRHAHHSSSRAFTCSPASVAHAVRPSPPPTMSDSSCVRGAAAVRSVR